MLQSACHQIDWFFFNFVDTLCFLQRLKLLYHVMVDLPPKFINQTVYWVDEPRFLPPVWSDTIVNFKSLQLSEATRCDIEFVIWLFAQAEKHQFFFCPDHSFKVIDHVNLEDCVFWGVFDKCQTSEAWSVRNFYMIMLIGRNGFVIQVATLQTLEKLFAALVCQPFSPLVSLTSHFRFSWQCQLCYFAESWRVWVWIAMDIEITCVSRKWHLVFGE